MTSPATTELPDLRPLLTRAQRWVEQLIAGVTSDQLDDPTPCADFDVRTLIGHLYTGARRVEVMAAGGDARAFPSSPGCRPVILPPVTGSERRRAGARGPPQI